MKSTAVKVRFGIAFKQAHDVLKANTHAHRTNGKTITADNHKIGNALIKQRHHSFMANTQAYHTNGKTTFADNPIRSVVKQSQHTCVANTYEYMYTNASGTSITAENHVNSRVFSKDIQKTFAMSLLADRVVTIVGHMF
jgi:hypothetical protein